MTIGTVPTAHPVHGRQTRYVVVVARRYVSEHWADGAWSPIGMVELHESVPGRYTVDFVLDPDGEGAALADLPVTVLARVTGPRWWRRTRRIGQPSLVPVMWFAEEVQHGAVIDQDEDGPVAWFERETVAGPNHHTTL